MKAAIPTLSATGNPELDRFAEAVKQNIDGMTGQQKNLGRLEPLPIGATDEEMRQRLNVLLSRMQD